jgi:toxin FitB
VKFLLDTSLVSEMVKPVPDPGVLRWLAQCEEDNLFLSVLTIGELEKGIAKLEDSRRRSRLANWVHKDLVSRFGSRLLSIDLAVAVRWGALVGDSERRGKSLPVIDSLLAATCLVYGLIVATRNQVDFKRCEVQCFDPWGT